MQKATSPSGFYQQTVWRLLERRLADRSLRLIGDELIKLAETALTFRQSDVAEEAIGFLLRLPLPSDYQSIGEYYMALCVKRHGDFTQARRALERLIESPATPSRYKARALQSIGATYYESDFPDEALRFYLEASYAASLGQGQDLLTSVMSRSMISAYKSIGGDHRQALTDLESITHLVRLAAQQNPFIYFDHANSMAFELGKLGRVEEAQNASRIALASPFASAYPEWRETGDELTMRGRRPPRTFVAFNAGFNQWTSDTGNVVALPVSAQSDSAEPAKAGYNPFQQPARIIDFQSWKRTMRKESNDTPKTEKTKNEMTTREKLIKIIGLISDKDLTDDQLERMLEAVERIACESQTEDRQ